MLADVEVCLSFVNSFVALVRDCDPDRVLYFLGYNLILKGKILGGHLKVRNLFPSKSHLHRDLAIGILRKKIVNHVDHCQLELRNVRVDIYLLHLGIVKIDLVQKGPQIEQLEGFRYQLVDGQPLKNGTCAYYLGQEEAGTKLPLQRLDVFVRYLVL